MAFTEGMKRVETKGKDASHLIHDLCGGTKPESPLSMDGDVPGVA